MDTDTRRESARIYRFPTNRAAGSKPKPARPVVTALARRGWYHDVAIQDAEAGKDPLPRG